MSILGELWALGAQIDAPITTVLVRESDVPAFRTALASSPNRPYAFGIGAAVESWQSVVAAYVRTFSAHSTPNPAEFFSARPAARDVFVHAARLSVGLREQNAQLVIDSCDELELAVRRAGPVPSSLPKLVDFFRAVGRECLAQFEYSSPLEHATANDTRKNWWSTQVPLSMAFGRMRQKLRQDFGGVPKNLTAVDMWLSEVEARLRRIQASPPNPATIRHSLVEASAYCSGLAERYLLRGQLGRAILLLHRSADLLLFEQCVRVGAIIFTVPGGQYHQSMIPPKTANRIHLATSLDILEGMNGLAPSPTRKLDLFTLNDWRNLLAESHYLSSPAETAVLGLFTKVRKHLELLGASDWVTARDTYVRGLELSPRSILDPDGVLESTVALIDPFA